ncbi:MAG: bifunctional DNA-formamidopyrimidine glycosylase/DNA-(apurinic or apyrimidinic site) lyase [Candidatus Eutrophobiaceae bacterium]
MPELPEVETVMRGITPHIAGKRIEKIIVYQPRLRWPVPEELPRLLAGQTIDSLDRRGKYLRLHIGKGFLLLHLGMSGTLRILTNIAAGLHDHLDILMADGLILRLHDPRRFGSVHWVAQTHSGHPLINHLGPEPLSKDFTGEYLHQIGRGRKLAIKNLLMDGRIVAGLGNIYANETLFIAGIRPNRAAFQVTRAQCDRLAQAVKQVLKKAISKGGTTLRDFTNSEGKPGYFRIELQVYGRASQECGRCGNVIRKLRQGQRSSFFCPHCQK